MMTCWHGSTNEVKIDDVDYNRAKNVIYNICTTCSVRFVLWACVWDAGKRIVSCADYLKVLGSTYICRLLFVLV